MLVQELSEEIEDYTQRFNTEDQLEWNLVLQEVAAFVEVRCLDKDAKHFIDEVSVSLKTNSISFSIYI